MVNKAGDNWSIVPAHTISSIALKKDSAVQFSSERRNELINHENKVSPKKSYFWEKGALIDTYA